MSSRHTNQQPPETSIESALTYEDLGSGSQDVNNDTARSALTRYSDGPFPSATKGDEDELKSVIEITSSFHGSSQSIVLELSENDLRNSKTEVLSTPFDAPDSFGLTVKAAPVLYTSTEGGLTTCADGGREYEKSFLKENPEVIKPYTYGDCELLTKIVRDALNDSKKANAFNPTQDFIPCTSLRQIITYETVCLLLPHCDNTLKKQQVEDYARQIAPDNEFSPSFRRIFTILMILKRPERIFEFIETSIDDSQLPISSNYDVRPSIFVNSRYWERQDFKDFYRVQWEVWPVFFSELGNRTVHYEFRAGEILPLMEPEEKWRLNKSGGYGEVTCYTLHPHQQRLKRYTKQGADRPIAVKKLFRATNKEEFDREHHMLDRLTHSLGKCPHLAKLLFTFQTPKGGNDKGSMDYFLVFECADGNLDDLWKSEAPGEKETPARAAWVASQCLGLVEALKGIHNFRLNRKSDDWDPRTHGFHGDLKPDNILLYQGWLEQDHDMGVLQITDFGLSSFHTTQTVENIRYNAQAGDYRPPEAQFNLIVSQSLDVWALGCIFLEFLTWLVDGPRGLKDFEKERAKTMGLLGPHTCFWQVVEKDKETGISLAQAVIDHTTKLCRSNRSSDFVRAFCEIIITNMLVIEDKGMTSQQSQGVVELSQDSMPPKKRIDAHDLEDKLAGLVDRNDSYYAPSSNPRYPTFSRSRHCIQVGKTRHVLLEEAEERYKEQNPGWDNTS